MKNHIKLIFIAFLAAIIAFSSCTRIDAGHEGVKVNLCGSNKDVDNVELCTGMVWFNPVTERVYEYPTFVQTVDYDPFTINAKDGSEFTVDPTLSIKMIDGSSPAIFKKYRKSVEDIISGTLYNYTKDAFRVQLNKFTTDEIVSKREEVEKAIEMQLRQLRKAWIGDWERPKGKPIVGVFYSFSEDKITTSYERLWINVVLSFPTIEMADDFLKCFRDLCETAKPLL